MQFPAEMDLMTSLPRETGSDKGGKIRWQIVEL